MRSWLRWLVAVLGLAAGSAGASFHLWSFTELYSNADGSIQFLEMTAITGGQQFLAGHTLMSHAPSGASNVLTFNRDLPGNSAGRKMLIATQGFAALGVVTPDYIVPSGFFFPGGGMLMCECSPDTWNHAALPTDGVMSLDRNGTTGTNSPTNFAGQTGRISAPQPPPSAHNVQALWWASPADSESGWGLNITHQGEILFATWFTYDTDGSGLWLVMSEGRVVSPNTYQGALYRTTGPPFNSTPFNPQQVVVTQVGSATLTFNSAESGSFLYTVNGITQTKQITRQVYASPVATCTIGAGGSPSKFQDLWWASPAGSESGWGVNITHQGDILFATWFTYGANGRGMWLVMSDGRRNTSGSYTGALYRTTGPPFSVAPWDRSRVTVTQVGTGTFTFNDVNNGTFAYSVDGISQTKNITRQVYATPPSICR